MCRWGFRGCLGDELQTGGAQDALAGERRGVTPVLRRYPEGLCILRFKARSRMPGRLRPAGPFGNYLVSASSMARGEAETKRCCVRSPAGCFTGND